MGYIALLFAEVCVRKNIINSDKKEICRVGMELILSDIINFSLIVIIAIWTKSLIYSIIYLTSFWVIRRFSGGFHAKTYSICRIVTIGTYLTIISLSRILTAHLLLCNLLCVIAALITMILFAPIKHPNKDLTDKERQINKLLSIVTTLFFGVISVILVMIGRKEGLIISLTLFAITILMYAALVINGKEVESYEEN